MQNWKNENIQILKENIKNDPAISICRCRAETGYFYGIIQRYLKSELKVRSYKLQLLQQIKPADYEKRVQFASTRKGDCISSKSYFL